MTPLPDTDHVSLATYGVAALIFLAGLCVYLYILAMDWIADQEPDGEALADTRPTAVTATLPTASGRPLRHEAHDGDQ